MILQRFYYTKDPLVGRAQQGAQANALKVLEEMRCGTCDGLSAYWYDGSARTRS
jgi:hypothetical protein